MEKIKVRNLHKEFIVHTRGGLKINGYHDINFELNKGEFLSLHGPSGLGKSSVLKALYRTYTTTSGEIIFNLEDGNYIDIAKANESEILKLRKEHIGYVSQFLQVLPRISAVDIVAQPLIDKGESEKNSKEKAKEMLNFLNIKEELFDISPLTFSGGEQQRVNIAKGIIAPKSVLLLDEPTASLDKNNTNKVIDKLLQIKKDGVTMIGIFHDIDCMKRISDKIYDMKEKKYANIN
ncbi:phosphonate C-P lyase system protein PhnL [Aliarcobacter cibarius]|uniref:Phosphonate C-P lyase system protein PhnL n=1 Tax=Aliarcobacter cibarius TaxID=255507 RepID=A0ABY2V300_9BACT|nr:phosphonate C-P lyase system protein PhnL [Aliarcobacter cibarius]MDD2974816.1 phosphonate C-P lyase system protein PhnL [Aliarcobacter cryaerophilus]TLS97594.1 phosphonate C-P lyase system protein PhnL [Aliarcobacter cibarius]TLS98109.1 phosphonate C-P lyase system protein PhnL [Aliarcobacter cibarius]